MSTATPAAPTRHPQSPAAGSSDPKSETGKPKSKVSLTTMRHVFTTIIWPRRYLILIGLVLILINRASGLVLPGASKYLIDEVINKNNLALLDIILLAVGGAIFFQAVSSYGLTQLLGIEAQRLIQELRAQVQAHIIRLPIRYFDNTRSGELVSRIMSDVEGVRNLVGTGLVQLIGGLLTSVASFVILLKINVALTLVSLIPLALFAVISMQAFKRVRPIFRERGKANAEVTGRLTEALNGVRVIKGFHAEAREQQIFMTGTHNLFLIVKRSMTVTSLVTAIATLLMGVASITLMWIGSHRIISGEMTVGDFFAFTLYLGFMIMPIVQMSNVGTQITEAFAGLDRMEEVLNEEQEGQEPRRTHTITDLHGDIAFENVTFSYEPDKPAVRDVSFQAAAGSVTAFVGSSGSGKTTLAGLAASFLKPDTGRVTIDGVDLSTVSLENYRSHLGVVLQNDFLFEGTIRENILYARPNATPEQVEAAAEAAYVKEFTDRFEKGLDTLIGERGVKLSGGQRQRVTIARAILADPRILLLDEATSSLDTESESYIQESLRQLMKGRTTFVIAHRLSTIRQANQILVIEEGCIVESGQHDDLIARQGRYYDLYTYQARI